jgi:hypothetical protein
MEETKTNDSVKTLKCTHCKKTKSADNHFLAKYSSKNNIRNTVKSAATVLKNVEIIQILKSQNGTRNITKKKISACKEDVIGQDARVRLNS